MWTCPICHRNFKGKNQSHSCYSTSVEDHLDGRSQSIQDCYWAFMDLIKPIGDFVIDPVKNTILLKHKSAFCAIKIARNWIDIHFMYHSQINSPLVRRSYKMSTYRWANYMRFHSKEELNEEVCTLIKAARDFDAEK